MVLSAKGQVIKNISVCPGIYEMTILAPEVAKFAYAGQFVMIRPSYRNFDPFLNRPFGISGIDITQGTIDILYIVVGKGTHIMTTIVPGEDVFLVGPIGKGFTLRPQDKKVALVAGGMGVAPLLTLAQSLIEKGYTVHGLLGASKADALVGQDIWETLGVKIQIATDDGSCGKKGFVTALLEDLLAKEKIDYIYCCGPTPMMAKTVEIAQKNQVPIEVSLEKRMGCGIGVCMGCICKLKQADGSVKQFRICYDGPVFHGEEVVFDD